MLLKSFRSRLVVTFAPDLRGDGCVGQNQR